MMGEPNTKVYLRPDVKMEPLVGGWYAWGHLLTPLQQALNVAFRQIPMLKSFLANPAIHEAAVRDPMMLGGPFVEIPASEAKAVSSFLDKMLAGSSNLLALAHEWHAFEKSLRESATGFSLESLYSRMPKMLRGFTELSYDVCSNPGIGIVEDLSYGVLSDYMLPESASFFRAPDKERKFFLNTPRIDSGSRLVIDVELNDVAFDVLSESRIKPVGIEELISVFNVTGGERERFLSLFTTEPPNRNEHKFDGDGIRLRYFGHACVLVQSANLSVLIDPLFVFDKESPEALFTFYDLPDYIDFIFITHNHQDHFCAEVLLQLRGRVGNIIVPRNNSSSVADPSMKLALKRLGFHNVTVMDPMDEIPLYGGGRIVSLPSFGEHADLNIKSKHGLFLEINNRKIAFLADSNCLDREMYSQIARRLGSIDTLFIGMECDGAPLSWLYSPYLPSPMRRKDDDSRRLSGSNCERATAVVEELKPNRAFIYAMGQEDWLTYLCGLQYTDESEQIIEARKFIVECQSREILIEQLYGCKDIII